MLLAGEADIVMETPFAKVGEVKNAGFKIVMAPAHPSCSLQFHTENPNVPWHDRRVRLAIAMAIDTESIVRDLFHGVPGHYARIAPWELGYDPGLKPYPFDVKKAKQLMAEAGYARGFKMPLYYITGRAAGQRETAEVVSVFLKAIGIDCDVEGLETIKIMQRVMNEWAHNPEGVFAGISTHPMAHQPDPTNPLDMVFWSQSRASMTHVPGLDEIHEKLRATMGDARRGELIKQAMKLVHDYVPSILLWANNSVLSMKPNIDYAPTLRFEGAVMYVKNVSYNNL
jgi:peptide/nickel transport system substrate-binding protein